MANNGTKIYIGSGNSKGIRLRADIETVLGESSGDLGTLCKSNNINPWAKYKPFRNAAKSFTDSSAWSTAMVAAKYGFSNPSSCLTFALSQIPPSWETCYRTYGKPRGLSNNEFYRALDFSDPASDTNGYDHTVGPPMTITLPSTIEQSGSNIVIHKDGSGSNPWNASTGVTLSNVFSDMPSNYNLAVVFKNGSYNNVLVTDYTPATLGTNGGSTVSFCGVNGEQSVPVIPMLNPSSQYAHKVTDGGSLRIVVCLIANQTPWTILEDYNGDFMSLEMRRGSNPVSYADLTYYETNSIVGTTGTMSIALTNLGSSGGLTHYRIDNITVSVTKGPKWNNRNSLSMYFQINIDTYWESSEDGNIPTGMPPYGDTEYVLNKFDTGIITQAGVTSGGAATQTVIPLSNSGSAAAINQLKKPHLFVAQGGSPRLRLTGYAIAGTTLGDPGTTIAFTDGNGNNYLDVNLNSIT